MDEALDQLEESKSQVGGDGDYAPWWNEDNFGVEEGDTIVGIVTERRAYEDPGGDDHPIAEIRSIGGDKSHLGEGVEVSTPTRKGIEPFAGELEVGDLALITYTGQVATNSGRDMHTYEASKLTQEEWHQMDIAEQIQAIWDGEAADTDVSSDDGGDDGVPEDAINFAEDTIAMNDGELTKDELDEYLNEIRDYGVDVDEVIEEAGFDVDGDTVTA